MLFLLLFLFLLDPSPSLAKQVAFSPKVSVSLGGFETRIFGYTSPLSKVELTSPLVYDLTYSDAEGYFEFPAARLPLNPSDLCLNSIDYDSRRTTPICIPPPHSPYNTDVGPIVLPPTLSLDKDIITPGSTVIASGQAIPNSPVNIFFFQENYKAPIFPKAVQAFSLPKLTITSNAQGYYSFNIPTAYSTNYRLFAATSFLDNASPKSNTLAFVLPSLFYLFWVENSFLIILLPLFILTLTLFFYLIHLYLNPLALPQKYWLTLYPKALALYPQSLSNPPPTPPLTGRGVHYS